jgi:DNA-binding transcriptional MerR regulator
MTTEWSIRDLARAAGTTSRTLRHYSEVGLLAASPIGANGYRFYDQDALLRLQRILLLRELGLGIPAITEVLAGQQDTTSALRTHLQLLEQERVRMGRQIDAVSTTLRKLTNGEALMATEALDGFSHTQYKDEVIQRWGAEAYEDSDRWWRSQSAEQKRQHQQTHDDIAADYGAALAAAKAVDSDDVQRIARRHVKWLSATTTPSEGYLNGLVDMWAADPRFSANYDKHRQGAAIFVRDAMKVYVNRHFD